jgi:hypothetical protein
MGPRRVCILEESIGPSFVNKKISEVAWEDVKIDGNEFAYKVYAGYKLPAFLAIEGGYRHLGKISDDIAEHNSSGWDLNAKGSLSLGPVEFFGKAGAFFNNVKVTFEDLLHPDINENNTKFYVWFWGGPEHRTSWIESGMGIAGYHPGQSGVYADCGNYLQVSRRLLI